MMIFKTVKAAVTARQAAEFYGVQVNRNGMCRCPFHPDKHPSMKIDSRYYCFGCNETGDVIDFVGKLFSLPPLEAAKKITADFGLDPNTPVAAAKKVPANNQRNDQLDCLRTMTDYERFLKEEKQRREPTTPDEDWDSRFVSACHSFPQVTWLTDCLFDPAFREQTAAELKEDLEHIRQWIAAQEAA